MYFPNRNYILQEVGMASTHEAAGGLRQVDRARGQVWAAYFSSWTWYVGAVLLVGFGLVEDLAPQWSAHYFLGVGFLGLVFGLLGHTRRGRAVFRMPAAPRSAVLGTGHHGTRRSQATLVAVWAAAVVLAVVGFGGVFAGAQGAGGEQAAPPVPFTVLYTAVALVCVAISLTGRRWAQRKIDGHVRR
jgi:hypothetical protein